MDALLFKPTDQSPHDIVIDVDDWTQRLGDGGFAIAYGCAKDPRHVLKCIDEDINYIDAVSKMRKTSTHASVMSKRLTQIMTAPGATDFARETSQTLLNTITTHVGYSKKKQRIYLYQLKAAGQSLESALCGVTPPWADCTRIALSFVKVMASLGRCKVVHLDCRPVNVFVDMAAPKFPVSLIDMDGCGVLSTNDDDWQDAWETPPTTMGTIDQMLRPIWFPIDPGWQAPLAGKFIFAEKWCVINEVWKILSWNSVHALGWLKPEHDVLYDAFNDVKKMYAARANYLPRNQPSQAELNDCSSTISRQFNDVFTDALTHTQSIRWVDYGIGTGDVHEDRFLTEFAVYTLLAFRDPRDLRLPLSYSNTSKPEIPSAQWIQNRLFRVMGVN